MLTEHLHQPRVRAFEKSTGVWTPEKRICLRSSRFAEAYYAKS